MTHPMHNALTAKTIELIEKSLARASVHGFMSRSYAIWHNRAKREFETNVARHEQRDWNGFLDDYLTIRKRG